MLTREVTPEMVLAWKVTFDQYRPQLRQNKKTGLELIAYLQQKYPITELNDERLKQVVVDNVLSNGIHANKVPVGKTPLAKGFIIGDTGAGKYLYEKQDALYAGMKIIVGVELGSGYFLVEGSSLLWDELFAFRGLDDVDLTNYYLVAEYISCLKKFDLLDRVLAQQPSGKSHPS